jgi:hypothetical protein
MNKQLCPSIGTSESNLGGVKNQSLWILRRGDFCVENNQKQGGDQSPKEYQRMMQLLTRWNLYYRIHSSL